MESINPATGELLEKFDYWDDSQLEQALKINQGAQKSWQKTSLATRCDLLRKAAGIIRTNSDKYAAVITSEMGKLISEARAEVQKCAAVCDYYADNAEEFLKKEVIETDAGTSYVIRQPIGCVLAVMPWNFPLWQVFRFAAPAMAAGNTGLLKHASNVPRCAQLIESIFNEAGFPEGVFKTLMISAKQVASVIESEHVHAVTLTGSEPAGKQVASTAGNSLKHSVLELGGSDAFIVMPNADMDEAVRGGIASRFLNAGQSCIAAKRFIVVGDAADLFVDKFVKQVKLLTHGDPLLADTKLAPMARTDLRDELDAQVQKSIAQGAVALCGCAPVDGKGAYYKASVLDQVTPGNLAYDEELFGPVAIIIRVDTVDQAIDVANGSRFGLGGSVWTNDPQMGEEIALQIESGAVFVNGMVKSDPRLPFGGIKASGYGRELCHHGMHEFMNAKTVWIK